ncbi:MAG: response regulator transcription factor [Ignavibacteriae bacterium]|nr:response regulator transcription factor [Ignavibacteriota bacterium]MCB9205984.1 response regulator transcription factor [Ignavibacteriales bacterium]
MIKVVIVEDSNTIREGLKLLIDGTEGYHCEAAYSNCEDLLSSIKKLDVDVILMDIDLPGISGIEGIREIKKYSNEILILILTVYDENDLIFEALCAGASGYLVKKTPPAKLLEAIKEAYDGGAPMTSNIARKVVDYFQNNKPVHEKVESIDLTPREKEVLSGLVSGSSYKAIADHLHISVETVRFHFRNIYKKLHVHSQSEAVVKAIKEGLV